MLVEMVFILPIKDVRISIVAIFYCLCADLSYNSVFLVGYAQIRGGRCTLQNPSCSQYFKWGSYLVPLIGGLVRPTSPTRAQLAHKRAWLDRMLL